MNGKEIHQSGRSCKGVGDFGIPRIEKIEAKPVMLSSSRVSLAKSEYETLAAAAKKYYAQERRESKLQKTLDAANKLIGELKAQITSLKQQISALTSELSEYKSVRGKIRTAVKSEIGTMPDNSRVELKKTRFVQWECSKRCPIVWTLPIRKSAYFYRCRADKYS